MSFGVLLDVDDIDCDLQSSEQLQDGGDDFKRKRQDLSEYDNVSVRPNCIDMLSPRIGPHDRTPIANNFTIEIFCIDIHLLVMVTVDHHEWYAPP
ncbi:hypothetical protein TSUD_114040 [Trifolium subterraneum]|uniref:Uncharacterized protein n=1 Tax=Trifolium subterraneum TaxID=3900 RepID=A0A2Z6M607_TRISU|nr:hypothetical protein TSUD_114040 [Trifolium subterraneum]